MQYRQLGNTNLEVSTVAFGCWAIIGGGTWGPQDEDDAVAALRRALELGVTFFDTAEAYGNGASEQLIGRTLAKDRDRIVIASKVSAANLGADALVKACDASLQRLGTDRIDLYQIHWPSRDTPLDETLGALAGLKQAGKVRQVGVSNFGPADLDDLFAAAAGAGCEPIASNQVIYSLLARMVEYEIQPCCVERGVALLPYSPLAQGLLTGKFRTPEDVPPGRARTRHFSRDREHTRHDEPGCEAETFAAIEHVRQIAAELGQPMAAVALAWLLHQPSVASVIAGGRNAKQVDQNVQAAAIELDAATLAALDQATQPVKQALGANADAWQSDSRMR